MYVYVFVYIHIYVYVCVQYKSPLLFLQSVHRVPGWPTPRNFANTLKTIKLSHSCRLCDGDSLRVLYVYSIQGASRAVMRWATR